MVCLYWCVGFQFWGWWVVFVVLCFLFCVGLYCLKDDIIVKFLILFFLFFSFVTITGQSWIDC